MKKVFPYHPFLFGTFPVLFLFQQNQNTLEPSALVNPLIVVLAGTALCFALGRLIFKFDDRAAAWASLIVFCFFSYGHLHNVSSGIGFRHRSLMPLFGVLFFAVTWRLWRKKIMSASMTQFLNIFSLILVLSSGFLVARFQLQDTSRLVSSQDETLPGNGGGPLASGLTSKPDIYYIILDGYGRGDVLKKIFGHDNSEFLGELKKLGFYVPKFSHSNYAKTFLSLSSSLNMEYLDSYFGDRDENSNERMEAYSLIRNNRIARILKQKGYKFFHFSSGWKYTQENTFADRNFAHFGSFSGFSLMLFQTTMVKFATNLIAYPERETILYNFAELARVPKIKGPKFIFSHMIIPHPPYLFDREGNTPSGIDLIERQVWPAGKYVDQIIFTNKKVLELVREIIAKSENPPIIVLHGDHGPAHDSAKWDNPDDEFYWERMSIFSAIYGPKELKDRFYDSVTPVNFFRIILDLYFNAGLGKLPDQVIFSHIKKPFAFRPIKVRENY